MIASRLFWRRRKCNNKSGPSTKTVHYLYDSTRRPVHQIINCRDCGRTVPRDCGQTVPRDCGRTVPRDCASWQALHGGAWFSHPLAQWRLYGLHGGAASFALMQTYRLARSCMHPAVHQPAVATAPQPMPGAVQASFASICMWNWTPSLPWLRDSRHRPHPCRLQLARRPSLLNRSRTHAFLKKVNSKSLSGIVIAKSFYPSIHAGNKMHVCLNVALMALESYG